MQGLAGGETADLLAGNAFVPEPRHGAEDAAGEQPVDRGFADAKGGGGFLDGIGQPLDGGGCGFGSRRRRLRDHGMTIADADGFMKRGGGTTAL